MLWARRRLPKIGPLVHGSVASVRDYVTDELGEPGRYEELRPAQDVVRRPPSTLEGDPLREPFATLQRHTHPAVFRLACPTRTWPARPRSS